MNAKTVSYLYSKILESNNGAGIVNIDLHVHTPASKDFKGPENMTEKEKYLSLIDEAIAYNLGIIAITDHNTFVGYNKLVEFIKENGTTQKKYKEILILCGIEITCYSNHLLAIFNSNFTEELQNQFLHEIGIDKESQGTEEAMADELGPSALLQKIDNYGGIAILAHADAEKGFFYSYLNKNGNNIVFKGKSLAKIIKSPYLYGIQVCSETGEKRIKDIIANKDYRRNDRKLPFLYFSDAHGLVIDNHYSGNSGKNLGSSLSKIKLSHKSFNALKMALTDVDTRIIKSINPSTYSKIIGCAIKSDIIKSENMDYAFFRFSDQLNCIIGSRGTGKSTLLGIINDVLEYEKYDYEEEPSYNDRYETAIIFIEVEGKVYAISNDIYGQEYRSVYIKSHNNSFKRIKKDYNFLNLFLTKTYRQGDLYNYHTNPNKTLELIDSFIMWKHYEEYGDYIHIIKQTTEDVGALFKKCMKNKKALIPFMRDEDLDDLYLQKFHTILDANNGVLKLRDEFVDNINKILSGKLKLRITFELDNTRTHFLLDAFPEIVAKEADKYYDYSVKIRNFMYSIIEKSKVRGKLDFFALLITDQIDKIFDEYCIPRNKENEKYIYDIRRATGPTELLLFLNNGISLEYNVNSGIKKAKPIFRENTKLSLGQNAVALLLIILTASQGLNDNRPLLMDQPEDDLDNSYIFNTLVEEFRRSKNKRQLIISTHNANIPVSADAENILVLKYNGEYGYLDNNGSLDNPDISEAVLDILEGGELALKSRNEKYRNIVKITK